MSENNLTLLDRSVVVIVDSPDDTASRRQGVSQSVERLHRMHGTSLIWESSQLLQVGASTFASACIIFHRFFNQYSLMEYDVWSVAMASTLLATKIEEEPHAFKTLINVYSYVYRKRIIATEIGEKQTMSVLEHPSIACLDLAKSSSTEEKVSLLKSTPLPSPLIGPVREEWYKQISEMEQIMLRHLGFTLFWIPDSHPHKFILYFCRVLEIDDSKFTQRAWNFCNDSCRLDLCVRFASEVIACTAIFLAARDFGVSLPTTPRPWWEVFCGSDKSDELITAANAILGLVIEKNSKDIQVATKAFVKSQLEKGSFNDPESFLWENERALLRKQQKLLPETNSDLRL